MYTREINFPEESFFLFGARGTGKTSLLANKIEFQLAVDLLSQESFLSYAGDPGLFRRQLDVLKPNSWVWIDEVQRLPDLLNEVHWGIEKKKLRFALSGSSSRKIRKAGVNLLGGRAIAKTLFPLTPYELGKDFSLDSVMQFGSIPLILSSTDRKQKLKAYVHSYLREEVQMEAMVKDLPAFVRFLKVAAFLHCQDLSLSSVARDVGVKRPTIENYFSVLEDTLLAYRLYPLDADIRVKEKRHPKFYWIDSGLVRALREEWGEITSSDKGHLFEGLIFMLLKSQQSYHNAFDEIFYWASSNLEVDFVIKKDSYYYAIEVKSGSKFRNEDLTGLRSINDLKRLKSRTLVYPDIATQKTEDGIEVLGLKEFRNRLESQRLFI